MKIDWGCKPRWDDPTTNAAKHATNIICITTNVLLKNRPLIFQDLFSTLVVLSSLLALLYSSQLKTSNTTNYHHTQDHVYHQSSTTPWKKIKVKSNHHKRKNSKNLLFFGMQKKQSKNYYEKLLTKTTTIVSSSKNHPCLGFLSSIKNMKWNTKHTKNSIYKKTPSKKNPSKSWELLTLRKTKQTETRTLLSKKQSWEYLFCKECCAAYY